MKKIEAIAATVGAGQRIWWAYVDGVMLRDKRGVGRRFKTEAAALKAGAAA